MNDPINVKNPNCVICGGTKMVVFYDANFLPQRKVLPAYSVFNALPALNTEVIEVYCSNCGVIYKPKSVLA